MRIHHGDPFGLHQNSAERKIIGFNKVLPIIEIQAIFNLIYLAPALGKCCNQYCNLKACHQKAKSF